MPKHLSFHQKNVSPRVRLRLAREAVGWSQEELGNNIGAGQVTVSRWETGETTPSPYFRKRLSQIFGRHPQDLDLESLGAVEAVSETVLYDPLIPQQPRALVGREEDLSSLKKRLIGGQQMILSAINGLPGVGKTTLAVAIAHDPDVRAAFPDGILWAGLGTTPDVIAHLRRWGTILGVEEAQMTSGRVDDLALMVRSAIGERRMLLVIDDAWKIEDALAFKIGGPHCIHLITTRILPIAVQLSPHDTVFLQELSVEQSLDLLHLLAPQVVEHEHSKARSLAQSVGGLPLALTLMGNYLRQHATGGQSRRVQAALERLKHAETRLHLSELQGPAERHPGLSTEQPLSLHAVIGITDQQLSEHAREALYALSVLPPKPDTFSETTALHVCSCDPHILDDLVDTGLLESSGDGRYMLHQTVADYAKAHLSSSLPAQRLLSYICEFVEEHHTDYELLDEESSTILTALEVAHDAGNPTELIRGACAFAPFLLLRGNYSLVERHLNRAYHLALPLDDHPSLITLYLYLGQLFVKQGDYAQSTEFFEGGLVLARRIEDQERVCALLNNMGWVTLKCGDLAQAEAYLQEGLSIARQLGNRENISGILKTLGSVVSNRGDLVQAETFLQEGLGIARQLGNREYICTLLTNLGVTVSCLGNYAQTVVYFEEGLQIARQMGYREQICLLLLNLGDIAVEEGMYEKAEAYFHEGLQIARQIGHREWTCVLLINLGAVAQKNGLYAESETYLKESLTLARQIDRPRILCNCLYEYANLYLHQQKLALAETNLREMIDRIPTGDQEMLGMAYYGLARTFMTQGKRQEAQAYGEKSMKGLEMMRHYKAIHVRNWLKTMRSDNDTF